MHLLSRLNAALLRNWLLAQVESHSEVFRDIEAESSSRECHRKITSATFRCDSPALVWLRIVDGVRLSALDWLGAGVAMLGMLIIVAGWGSRN